MNNLLTIDHNIADPFLRSVVSKIRENLSIFKSGINITNVKSYGNILVGSDSVSIFICDPENTSKDSVIRSPKTGDLIHVEKQIENGSVNYYIFYQTADGVIVDKVKNGAYEVRRNLSMNSKYNILCMFSCEEYVLIIDTEKNIEIVDKKDIYTNDYTQVLTSRSYVLNRSDLFSTLSRAVSSFYSADIMVEGENVVVLVAGGSGKHVYKVVLDSKSLKPISSISRIGRISGCGAVDLKAVSLFDKLSSIEQLSPNNIKIISATSDSKNSFISTYNKEIKKYEHYAIQSSEDKKSVKTILKFTTESSFSLKKLIELNYPNAPSKFLCLDINNGGNYTKYLIINAEMSSVESQGATAISTSECSMLKSTLQVDLDEMASIIEVVEESEEYVE